MNNSSELSSYTPGSMQIKTIPRGDSWSYSDVTVNATGVELRCYARRDKIQRAPTLRRLSNVGSNIGHRSGSCVFILDLANHNSIWAGDAYHDRDHIIIIATVWND